MSVAFFYLVIGVERAKTRVSTAMDAIFGYNGISGE